MAIDRPPGFFLSHASGKQALVRFKWGVDSDPVPVGVRVVAQLDPSGESLIGESDGPLQSIDDARMCGIELATNWYDRGNG
ncbi:hypothetical protein SAMN05216205_1173 [Pseudomonas mohnii]|uniref:Uncharacterized protein n=1 Tax=Pseudomonas mohnii TaxID=395600 RepID=A0ABY0XRW7_9PSED|nr:hypothetical protein SAMN05216205_1173 [Pseudomonas mohnii]